MMQGHFLPGKKLEDFLSSLNFGLKKLETINVKDSLYISEILASIISTSYESMKSLGIQGRINIVVVEGTLTVFEQVLRCTKLYDNKKCDCRTPVSQGRF